MPWTHGNLAVQRERRLERHKRQSGPDPFREVLVPAASFFSAGARVDANAGAAQLRETSTGHRGVRVWDGSDNTPDARINDCVGAGPGAPNRAAGFERHVKGRATRFGPRLLQRDDFGVI